MHAPPPFISGYEESNYAAGKFSCPPHLPDFGGSQACGSRPDATLAR